MIGGYILSIPERLVRALSAGMGGLIYQLSQVLLPEWVRGSRFYRSIISRPLRLLIELPGGVEGVFPVEDMPIRELATRKAAGNVVEAVSFVAVGWSPVWLLAAAADVMGGTQVYLRALIKDLRQEGVLSPETQIDSVEQLLTALEQTVGQAADTVDMPPLNVDDMRKSWTEFREKAANLPNAETLARIYDDLKAVAHQERQSIYRTSSLIALGAARTGVRIGQTHIFDYYRNALDSIASEGLSPYIKRVSRPYRRAVAHHLDPRNRTYTELYLQRRRQRRQSNAGNT